MTVLWDEVPCSGQNGPITGYLLYYTNATFNDTVNIIGGDNRQYNLTTLMPYTNYTMTIKAYNDGGIGPASSEIIQQTGEEGKSLLTLVIFIYCRTCCGIWSNTKWHRDTSDQHYMEYTHSTQWCYYHV